MIFPAFNDEKTIEAMVAQAMEVLSDVTDDYEIVVVNDGSTDETERVLKEIALRTPCLTIISHETNEGYGAAVRRGLSHASKDLVFYTDGDGQYDPRELRILLPLMTDTCDVVNGYRLKRADSRRRVIIGAIYNRFARTLFRLPVRDVDCDFRLIRRRSLEGIDLVSSSGAICVEMIAKLRASGCTFREAPVQHYHRAYGRSQFFTLGRVSRTGFDFVGLWMKLVVSG